MPKFLNFVLLAVLVLALGGFACKKKSPEVPFVPPPPPSSGQVDTFEDNPLPPWTGPVGGSGATPFDMNTIYFDFDKYQLKEEARQALKDNAQALLSNPSARILIQGNCDERGTNEYNLALGERRANAARDYLISLGVDASRVAVLSLGEEQPACSEHYEDCWWKNRRDDFVSQ